MILLYFFFYLHSKYFLYFKQCVHCTKAAHCIWICCRHAAYPKDISNFFTISAFGFRAPFSSFSYFWTLSAFNSNSFPNSDWDFTCFKRFNNCYILLLNSPQFLENTGFVAGELSLIVSLVLYRPTSVYEHW